MTPNNNFSVLPWYNNINEQAHRQNYAYGEVYPLFAPCDTLLPFQIVREHSSAQITKVTLHNLTDGTSVNITTAIKDVGLQIIDMQGRGIDVIIYEALLPLSVDISEGRYYLELTDGVNTYYSEVMTCVKLTDNYTKIEWYDEENLLFDSGIVYYEGVNYKNILYLCTEIGKPEYKYEEEGDERDGYFFPIKQLSEKTYKFTILAPEYLCDVMRFIRLADHIKITDKYGRVYDADAFLMSVNWQQQGYLASVECEFETDTIVKRLAKGYVLQQRGDFNNDYNNDYNNM